MKQGYKAGDKHKVSGDTVKELGLNDQSKIEGGTAMKLRGENNEAEQKPMLKKHTVSSDRGSFPCK